MPHTPPEWATSERTDHVEVHSANNPLFTIARVRGFNMPEARDNARLIVAAPDLLAACQAVAGVFAEQEDMPLYARKCIDATAKATGK